MIIKLFRAYRNLSCDSGYLEWYRSGHNEHDWKSCGRVERPEGSNPSHSAIMKAPENLILRRFCFYIQIVLWVKSEFYKKNVLIYT